MESVFDYNSYKDFLKKIIQLQKSQRGFQSKMAKFAGCQPSYLSQALIGKADLLPDHILGIAKFLTMTELETDMFLTLLQRSRATSLEYKYYLDKKIEHLRDIKNDLSERMKVKKISTDIEKFYYTSWYWSAVHIATSVPGFQTAEELSKRLSIPLNTLALILSKLESHGLILKKGKRWVYKEGAGHLPKESLMTELNHTHLRQRAILDVQKNQADSIHYSSVFTMKKEDSLQLNELIIKFLSESRKISDPSMPEEVFCLNLDYFKI